MPACIGKRFLYSNKIRASVFDVSPGNSCALLARSRGFSFKTNGTTHAPRSARTRRAKKARKTRDRAFSLFVRATIVKKNFNEEPFDSNRFDNSTLARWRKRNARSRLKNAERRKAHNDAADDDEKEEEEKMGEKESRKARREKIPP